MQVDITMMREEATQVGERIYQQTLKPLLERAHDGQIGAIYIPSGIEVFESPLKTEPAVLV